MDSFLSKESREDDIKQIEDDIEKLRDTAFILNALVCEQEYALDSIEDYIEINKNEIENGDIELESSTEYEQGIYSWYIKGGLLIGTIFYLLL